MTSLHLESSRLVRQVLPSRNTIKLASDSETLWYDIYMQVVGAIIKNHENEYLLQLRDDKAPSFKNRWTLFGGHIEAGEEPDEALLRELDEELTLSPNAIESMQEIQTNEDPNGTKQYIFEVLTGIALRQLMLNEGAEMRYVSQDLLFDRKFAFNIEEVLRQYLARGK